MRKGDYANICHGCRCRSCVFSVENQIPYALEIPKLYSSGIEWHACFSCDHCRHFDNNRTKRDYFTQTCPEYVIDEFHAIDIRKHFRILER